MPDRNKFFQVRCKKPDSTLYREDASCYLGAVEIARKLIKSGHFEKCIIHEITSKAIAKVTGSYDSLSAEVRNPVRVKHFVG